MRIGQRKNAGPQYKKAVFIKGTSIKLQHDRLSSKGEDNMFWKRAAPLGHDDAPEIAALYSAINENQAVIWFDPNGTILRANAIFCKQMATTETEIVGKHHSLFMSTGEAQTERYADFWRRLRRGESIAGDFTRVARDGRPVYLAATYNALRDKDGKVITIIKLARDRTEKQRAVIALQAFLKKVSDGDLSVRMQPSPEAEFDQIGEALNETVTRLDEMIASIEDISDGLAGEANEIAGNAQDLAHRGEAQAATLEETAAALEEISVAVQGTASNAQQATMAAQAASESAGTGTRIVSNAISAMSEIKNGSNEIGKIIEVIDSISFQTNLLALNAGIEAARAGDAGRGFAVVASEIRALAQRTAEAAKDISNLIVSSNANVSSGAKLVDQTGEALTQIVNQIGLMVNNIEEISSASSEQAEGITSVTQATSQIDIATQQNAVLADQSAQSAAKLARGTATLRELISGFRSSRRSRPQDQTAEITFRRSA